MKMQCADSLACDKVARAEAANVVGHPRCAELFALAAAGGDAGSHAGCRHAWAWAWARNSALIRRCVCGCGCMRGNPRATNMITLVRSRVLGGRPPCRAVCCNARHLAATRVVLTVTPDLFCCWWGWWEACACVYVCVCVRVCVRVRARACIGEDVLAYVGCCSESGPD